MNQIKMITACAMFCAAMLGAAQACARAELKGADRGWTVVQPSRFMVSGVLRKDGTTDTIKAAHSIVEAPDADQAILKFTKQAMLEYQGYTLIATVVSPVPAVGDCINNI